jgi:hypothetical protein
MTFSLSQLAFNKGWRYKITDGQRVDNLSTPLQLNAGETRTIHEIDIEDGEILSGYLMAAVVTSTDPGIAVQAITDPPGAENDRRSGIISAQELIRTGATDPRTNAPWVEVTNVQEQTFYNLWFNGFDGFGAPARYPRFSRVEVSNQGPAPIQLSGFRVTSLLIHRPELFFRQLAAFNLLTGLARPEVLDMDDSEVQELIGVLKQE